ncbi:MAG: aromatic amino acid lyase, partial [Pseudomonadota bacterium]
MTVVLAPGAATLDQLYAVWHGGQPAELANDTAPKIQAAAALVAKAAAGEEAVYGVNTGFGKLASVKIAPENTAALQRNLVLSHCCGVGEPLDTATARLMLALKLLSLGRGASGVALSTVRLIEAMLAKNVTPVIPSQG